MTNKILLEVTCVHCLEKGEKEVFPIINKDNLEAKNRIFEEDLFLYRCPHCGYYQKNLYDCIYYDDKIKYAVVLSCDGRKLLKRTKLDLRDYQIRFVEEVSKLKEKIIIIENELDERIIDIMKHDLCVSLINKATYELVLNDKLEFVLLYPDNEIIKTFTFSKSDYVLAQRKYIDY